MTDEEFNEIAKIIIQQGNLLGHAAMQIADQACLLLKQLPKCKTCDKYPTTVKHIYTNVEMCDRCAAQTIVTASREYVDGYIADPHDPMNDVRESLSAEFNWVDDDDAERIRRLIQYTDIIKEMNPDRGLVQ